MPNLFTQAMQFRHACKLFDETKKISDEHIRYILEAGRTSPSSFGQEAWKFLVITNEELKAKLRPHCWNQPQITSCSHLVVILAGIDAVKLSSGIVQKRFERRPLSPEQIAAYLERYQNHLTSTKTLSSDEHIYEWTARQCYIAAANMMTAAAFEGIDSCPIEGFEKDRVEAVLNLDTKQYQVALILPFGYRINAQSPQIRRSFDEVVEFID